jgi:hypothetical protein
LRRETAALGLDLGTTNTTLASLGRPMPLGETGAVLLPSAVAFLPSGTMLVGEPAKNRRAIDPTNTLVSTKRVLGVAPGVRGALRVLERRAAGRQGLGQAAQADEHIGACALRARHAQDRGVHVDVLAAGQVRVEAGAQLQEGRDAAVDGVLHRVRAAHRS